MRETKEVIRTSLDRGYGTLLFDVWEDVTGSSIVNILSKTESGGTSRVIFFLKSFFIGTRSMNAEEYQEEVEKCISEFVPNPKKAHYSICCIVSDKTVVCIKVHINYSKNHRGVVSINDTNHLIDLLMEDVGKLDWISEVINAVTTIFTCFYQKKKFRDIYKQLSAIHNFEVSTFNRERNIQCKRKKSFHKRDLLNTDDDEHVVQPTQQPFREAVLKIYRLKNSEITNERITAQSTKAFVTTTSRVLMKDLIEVLQSTDSDQHGPGQSDYTVAHESTRQDQDPNTSAPKQPEDDVERT